MSFVTSKTTRLTLDISEMMLSKESGMRKGAGSDASLGQLGAHVRGPETISHTSYLSAWLPILRYYGSRPSRYCLICKFNVLLFPRFVVKARICRFVISVLSMLPHRVLSNPVLLSPK